MIRNYFLPIRQSRDFSVPHLYKNLPAIKLEYPLLTAMAIKKLVGPVWPVPKDQVPPLACDPLDLAGTYFHPGYGYATVLADAHTGEMRLVRARNEVDTLHRVTALSTSTEPANHLAFFTYTESPLRVRFVKDEAVKDPRPLPKRKAGFAWREKVKYRMVLTEGTAQLDIVFERVDF
ncbi:hypothetical protein BCR44DRAFT_53962 [Catenaria anguillulae PL171]|uniref:Uncharacterized protein n=1 Tax=Catenaria anguillulae PL171 TaxID=765915 RepID=A0A1Y2H3R1_9FUNG|nr:hypothetical protein BCR44DRAFT_53962 [Catenaria anguillulae PL171]